MPSPQKRRSQLRKVENILQALFTFISFTGLIVSIGLHLILLSRGIRYKEIEYVAFLTFGVIFLLTYRTTTSYFSRLPWLAKIIPIVIVLYGLWTLFTGPFGALEKLPAGIRAIAVHHQTIFLHSIMIGGYTFLCTFWWYSNQKQPSKNHA